MAFQIHNGPAQCLATALALFRTLDRSLPPEMSEVRQSLRATIKRTEIALEETRRAIGALRSPKPDLLTGRLATYLRGAFDQVPSRVKPELILDIAPGEHLPSGIVTGLAEVGREAVANAARHAAAQHVWVTMRRTRHAVVLEVKDDGTGFEGAGHGGPRRRRHSESRFGLALMQDQMRLLGGTLSIRKVPGEGTTVRASVPLAAGAVAPPRRIRRTATA